MKVIRVKNDTEMSERAASVLFEEIKHNPRAVLGLATGGTPEGTYQELIKKAKTEELNTSRLTTFNLDEYVGLPTDHPASYHTYMQTRLFSPLGLASAQTHLPRGEASNLSAEAIHYEHLINERGPIDLQLLGIGENGHIGFNEPGTSFESRTHIVDLKPSTRSANARYFQSVGHVPQHAITMGISTIMSSRRILLLASGERKKEAIRRLLEGDVDEDFPASVLQNHSSVTIIADSAALSAVSMEKEESR